LPEDHLAAELGPIEGRAYVQKQDPIDLRIVGEQAAEGGADVAGPAGDRHGRRHGRSIVRAGRSSVNKQVGAGPEGVLGVVRPPFACRLLDAWLRLRYASNAGGPSRP